MKPRGRRSVPTKAQACAKLEHDRAQTKAIADRARATEQAERARLDAELDEQLRAIREGAGS